MMMCGCVGGERSAEGEAVERGAAGRAGEGRRREAGVVRGDAKELRRAMGEG